ncbi:hypothetical protein [Cellulomonas endometrii]|uniref:hypothetical protein n=1 Tax=Cellulomonas endometrii TaxID=3036301 RepID=UPI0024AD1EC8|nr:hypothetical protein [Cellulomonas endometrii]
MTAALAPVDGALRARLDEREWAMASAGVDGLPGWADVLPVDRDGSAVDPPGDGAAGHVDPALRGAVEACGAALVAVEVAAVARERAVLAVLRTDTRAGCGLARGVDVVPAAGLAGTTPRPGVEVSVFPVGRLVDEVLRHVPPAPVRARTTAATVPEELTVALARALRTGDRTTVDALCAELGTDGPPAVVDSAVRSADGSLVVTVRSVGRTDVSALSLLRCDAGWVELTRTTDERVAHTPRSRADVRTALLHDLAGRFPSAADAEAPA